MSRSSPKICGHSLKGRLVVTISELRFAGIRTSKERVRRLMRQHGLQAPQRTGHPHGPKAHDGTIITEQPDVMWGTDATTTITVEEGQAYVFSSVDHCTFECTGIHASASGNRFEALEPLRQGVRAHFGGYTEKSVDGLAVRHDHGPAYMADDFQNELTFLGITSSPSFIREPEGNGCAERFIRLLKENLLWVKYFCHHRGITTGPDRFLSSNTTSSGSFSATTIKPRHRCARTNDPPRTLRRRVDH